MMSKQVCQTRTWAHIMCRLGRALRSGDEDEGRGEEGRGGGAVTTEETRWWDEGPSGQVKVDRDPHYRSLCQCQAYRPLCACVYVYNSMTTGWIYLS
jgi:hypothetical protein